MTGGPFDDRLQLRLGFFEKDIAFLRKSLQSVSIFRSMSESRAAHLRKFLLFVVQFTSRAIIQRYAAFCERFPTGGSDAKVTRRLESTPPSNRLLHNPCRYHWPAFSRWADTESIGIKLDLRSGAIRVREQQVG
jgi:hypothetical protein